MQKIFTLILSDDFSTLKLLKLYLSEFDNLEILEEQSDYKSILYTLSQLDGQSIFIVDLTNNRKEKLDLITRVSSQCLNCQILALSGDPTVDLIVQIMRTGAREFVPVPIIRNEFFEAMNKTISLFDKPKKTSPCKIITIFSNKGGVGKTTVATNLALEISKMTGENVLILDMDFQMGDVSTFLNIKSDFNVSYMLENIDKINETYLLSTLEKYKNSTLYILADPPYFRQADNVSPKQLTKLLDALKDVFSYIIIDAEASFDSKNIAVLDNTDSIILLTLANMPALRNTQRCLEFFERLGYDRNKVKLVVNRYSKEEQIKVEDIVKVLGRPVYKTIPNDYESLMTALNIGVPVCIENRDSEVSKSLKELAKDVSDNLFKQNMVKKFEDILNNY